MSGSRRARMKTMTQRMITSAMVMASACPVRRPAKPGPVPAPTSCDPGVYADAVTSTAGAHQ
jgi:hypothetical protein